MQRVCWLGVPEGRQRERYAGRLAVPRQRDERLANPEERGRGCRDSPKLKGSSAFYEMVIPNQQEPKSETPSATTRFSGDEKCQTQQRENPGDETAQNAAGSRYEN